MSNGIFALCQCGQELEFEIAVDSEHDLIITAIPCEICMDDNYSQGIVKGRLLEKGEKNERTD